MVSREVLHSCRSMITIQWTNVCSRRVTRFRTIVAM
ncbi:unnamed protein product [Gongylonema pulchrum]|uniref:Uncharacterized protein n=1 Tax=Gongylonema pulchrum TaxID=637853 RepID=A0A3P6SEM8_9BILA|nr:unnamed protein product [Gongylonema pulchrum]